MQTRSYRPNSPPKSRGEPCAEPSQWPSGHYPDVIPPSTVLLRRASEPPHPVLPKQTVAKQLPKTMRERLPLSASLTGAGRAGKPGCLSGSTGSKYKGAVLAGRPHGKGQYFAPPPKPGGTLRLSYEGDFVRGAREGQGTCYYHTGEVYVGSWVCSRRTGPGRLTYVDGSMYYGMWRNDRRHGVGTYYSTCGDIFVGTFNEDKRHGLGTTYMPSRGKKYVAEYVNDSPKCGSFFDLAADDVEPPATQQLRGAIAAGTLRQTVASGVMPGQLPPISLMQPSKVLAKEFVAVREQRQQLHVPALDHTLSADSISLLRHAFMLMAGGDDGAAFVLPHQLQELVVLAGLDPVAPPVVKLMGLLQQQAGRRAETAGHARLHLEEFLGVVCFFREKELDVFHHEQVQQAAAEAAARAAVQAAAEEAAAGEFVVGAAMQEHCQQKGLESEGGQQQQEELQDEEEQWQQDSVTSAEGLFGAQSSQDGAVAESSGAGWGAAADEPMLERHIEQHRADSAGSAAKSSQAADVTQVPSDAVAAAQGVAAESSAVECEVRSIVEVQVAAGDRDAAMAQEGIAMPDLAVFSRSPEMGQPQLEVHVDSAVAGGKTPEDDVVLSSAESVADAASVVSASDIEAASGEAPIALLCHDAAGSAGLQEQQHLAVVSDPSASDLRHNNKANKATSRAAAGTPAEWLLQ